MIKVNDMDLRVIALFTKGFDNDYYIREVSTILNISSKSALNTLSKLEQYNIVSSKKRGKTKLYFLNRSQIARDYVILAEVYKKIKFLKNNILIERVIIEVYKELSPNFLVIFGSYSKGLQKKGSDLDIFTLEKGMDSKIKEIGKVFDIEINTKFYPYEIFREKIDNDYLLKEIVKNHIIIKGFESFVDSAVKWID